MSKIKKFDKPTVNHLRRLLDQELKAFGEKHGLKVTPGNAIFMDGSVDVKVNFAIINEDGVVQTKEKENWDKYFHWYSFEKSDFGREFDYKGDRFKITGLKPRNRMPVLAQNVKTGKSLAFSREIVQLV